MAPTKKFFASTLTEAAGCSPITFRAWRNRNGLFPETQDSPGWNRFSIADITAVTLIVRMIAAGMNAQEAVDIAMKALPIIEKAYEREKDQRVPAWLVVNIGDERGITIESIDIDDDRGAVDALVSAFDLALVLGLGSAMSHVVRHIRNNDVPIAGEDGSVEKVLIGEGTRFSAELAARAKVEREIRKSKSRAKQSRPAAKKKTTAKKSAKR